MRTETVSTDALFETSLLEDGVQGVIGKATSRIDGPLKVSGTATYSAEYDIAGAAYGYLVLATVAKATVTSLDDADARKVPGVLDIFTSEKFLPHTNQPGQTEEPKAPNKHVLYAGQPIALVVAETFEAARDAAHRLRPVYAELPATTGFDAEHGGEAQGFADRRARQPGRHREGDGRRRRHARLHLHDAQPEQRGDGAPHHHRGVERRRADAALLHADAEDRSAAARQGAGDRQGEDPFDLALRRRRLRQQAVRLARDGGVLARRQGARPPDQDGDDAPAGVRMHGAPFQHAAAHPARRHRRGQAAGDRPRLALEQPAGRGLLRAVRDRHAFPLCGPASPHQPRCRAPELDAVGLDARAGRGCRHAGAGVRDGRDGREARPRSDRVPQAQRAQARPGEGHPVLDAPARALHGRGCRAVRLGQAHRAGAASRGRVVRRHRHGGGGACQPDDAGQGSRHAEARRHRARRDRHDRHRHRHLHDPGADRRRDARPADRDGRRASRRYRTCRRPRARAARSVRRAPGRRSTSPARRYAKRCARRCPARPTTSP